MPDEPGALIPTKQLAGTLFQVTIPAGHFLASDGWSLRLILINAAQKINITSTADGDDHAFSETAATTATWVAGNYDWFLKAEKSGEEDRFIDSAGIEILTDVEAAPTSDERSHARIVFESINAVIEERATKDQMSYQIGGRQLSLTPLKDLLEFRTYYSQLVDAEIVKDNAQQGRPSGKKIRTRFVTGG